MQARDSKIVLLQEKSTELDTNGKKWQVVKDENW
jgi:hypothetical protein